MKPIKPEPLSEWRPPSFTAQIRDQPEGGPPNQRWEAVLRAERSTAHQLITLAARNNLLRQLLGLSPRLAAPPGPSLDEREARVEQVLGVRLGRMLSRLSRQRLNRQPQAGAGAGHKGGPPPVSPILDGEIDVALALLRTVAFEELQRRGWHLQPNHFYWPLNDVPFLRDNPQLWTGAKLPRKVDFDLEAQAGLARRLAGYAGELADVRAGRPRRGEFVWGQRFPRLDAYAYYGLVRDLRPSCVVEVGAGLSSILLARTLTANGASCDVTLVDPHPPWLLGELPGGWKLIPELVQHVDLELFDRLQAGDILFYDGSHCVRTGSDVNWIFFEVLPRLAPGVWIHVHDILWPFDYRQQWVLDQGLSWNEQYLLHAFLMHNGAYRVRLGTVALQHYQSRLLAELFPGDLAGGTSLWLEKVAA